MRILFADAIGQRQLDALSERGHQCTVERLSAEELPDHIPGHDVLVVRSTRVSAATIEASDRLGLIVRAGAGTDTIDRAAASAAGVYLCNVPGRNAIAVAELTLALLLAVDRQIADGVADLRAGLWDKSRYSKADGIHGKQMAIVGLGDIGLAVAERAAALGVRLLALRRPGRSTGVSARIQALGIHLVDDLDELLPPADIVSVHVPSSPETVGLVDADFLARMRDGAILLNTARGNVVDEVALLDVLDRRQFRAGLDVFANEPSHGQTAWVSPLAQHQRVVGSHHIGASTAQAQNAVADGVVEVIESFQSGSPINCLNLMERELADQTTLVIRHLDQVGVLAAILMAIRERGINVQQMQNHVFEGSKAAVATIGIARHLESGERDALLHAIADLDKVLGVGAA